MMQPRTHDILDKRIDEPEDQHLKPHSYLLPVAVGFSLLSFVASLPFSIAGDRINEHDVMRPSDRFAAWVLGRKYRS